ncbi:MAG: hypothetical protein KC978_24370 [Candidatus Omnitrophica bacterium]|nr:hypothetical protein [Candidatus Omnitrophota bacterium]
MQRITTCTSAYLLGLALLTASQAHNLEAEIAVDNIQFTVRAFFEDGTPARSASAEVIAPDGQVLAEGVTDSEGRFTFSDELKGKIEVAVEDNTGHREVFPLSPAAIALAIKGEATELEHTHGEGGHHHSGDTEGDHDHGEEETDHLHGDDPISEAAPEKGLVLTQDARGGQTNRVISGLGYVLGITGILFYFLGYKQKAGA